MSGPTYGQLHIDSALTIPRCSPVFLWSSDSQFLVVVQWWQRFGILRRQRLLLLDIPHRAAAASKALFRLIVLHEFTDEGLHFTDSPLHKPQEHRLSLATMRQTFKTVPYETYSESNIAYVHPTNKSLTMNSILAIAPYRYEGTWVFDDERVDLFREPFVAGADHIIDLLTAHIPDADQGFRLTFSAQPFPGHQVRLVLDRPEYGGYWYSWPERNVEGWLCPALFKYFETAPKEIYAQASPRNRNAS